ncbi:Rv3235 family protein [Angustibacter luteus]|uniref:Rv3235 family protein n=1 Tax=Angustibacter luteus TaxID=658456 RepID=A0ABW1JHP4_9ACTN
MTATAMTASAMTATATPLRPLPVPDTAPPVEWVGRPGDAAAAGRRPSRAGGQVSVQGVLRLVLATPLDEDDDFGPVPTPRRDLPDPAVWGRGLVQVLLEVMSGQRKGTQLLRWTTPAVYELVRAMTVPPASSAARQRRRSRVGSLHVCEPADGVAELAAVVTGQERTHAMALRLEGHDGRWRVTAFETC